MDEALNAGDVCTRIVVVAGPRDGLAHAAALMRSHHVGCLVVVEADTRRVVGLLTDRDIVTAVVARGLDPQRLLVEDVMVREVVTARPDESFIDLLRTMRRKGLRRLPVTTPSGTLLGLVTLDDALGILAEQLQFVVQAIAGEQGLERQHRP